MDSTEKELEAMRVRWDLGLQTLVQDLKDVQDLHATGSWAWEVMGRGIREVEEKRCCYTHTANLHAVKLSLAKARAEIAALKERETKPLMDANER